MQKEARREKLTHHIAHLQEKHDELDTRIKLDKDPEYLTRILKKEKLELKDDIVKFKTELEGL